MNIDRERARECRRHREREREREGERETGGGLATVLNPKRQEASRWGPSTVALLSELIVFYFSTLLCVFGCFVVY